jgi:predicted FMN-binding regulatory protein PaiB
MCVPPHAREEVGFGTLVTIANDRPMLAHLPMLFVPTDAHGTILGHVSHANAVAAFVGPLTLRAFWHL